MQSSPHQFRFSSGIVVVVLLLTGFLFVPAAAGADASIEGYLGETITLHGVSYVGDTVYLFLTGPNLPKDGVTLTDTSLRADQGHFTVVGVDSSQEWSYNWKTSRIATQIDPGTYTVYVSNEPADLSALGRSGSYQTLSVYLKDPETPKVSVNAGHSYTLNPEEHVSTPLLITNVTSVTATTSAVIATTASVSAISPSPTTRADPGPLAAVSAALSCAGFAVFFRIRR